jgi:hypothetical protein
MHHPAPTAHAVLVILGNPDPDLGDLMLLITIHHAQINRIGQINTTAAIALRKSIDLIIRHLGPGQIRTRRPGCLPFLRVGLPSPGVPFAGGGVRPRSSSFDGGDDELPEFRDSTYSSRASFSVNALFASRRSATCLAIALICSSAAASRSACTPTSTISSS